MNRDRMQAILDAYGVDAKRWPEDERVAAQAWSESHAEDFATMAREAAALDAVLAFDVRDGVDDAALAARVLAMRAGDNVVTGNFTRHSAANDWWRPAAALAACAVLGLAIGFTGAPRGDDIAMDIDAAFGAAFDMQAVGAGDGAGG